MGRADGRKALITGGASGIGLATARLLAREGASIALLDVDAEQLAGAAAEVGGIATPADVRSADSVRSAVEHASEQLGGLDTLVVCAGVVHVKRLSDVAEADWDHVLDINLKGAFLCCQAAAPALTASGRGRIVTISSDAGRRGVPLMLAYTASKFGLIGLTESLAAELAPHVTVNSVCPVGVAGTGMGQKMLAWKVAHTGRAPDDVLAGIARDLPLGRGGTAEDMAEAVLYFVADSGSFVTGVSLDVDGGASLNVLPGAEEPSA